MSIKPIFTVLFSVVICMGVNLNIAYGSDHEHKHGKKDDHKAHEHEKKDDHKGHKREKKIVQGHGHSHGKGGHTHEPMAISVKQTQKIAMSHILKLISSKKLDNSWTKAIYDKSIQKSFGKKKEWVVTFDNPKGVKGKKVYIFLKLSGKYIAANFSGK